MNKVKRAIFIAAGEGSRLRPVTLYTPKPLVKVNGKRILDCSIEALYQNGIEEIYIVVGYKKEQFIELYSADKRIHIIENENYLKGNNITSMYLARDYLPESIVLEADIIIKDPAILNSTIEKSGYFASWKNPATEWVLDVENNSIKKCEPSTKREGYQLWGISFWNQADGERLADMIREKYENNQWNAYWDEIALVEKSEYFDLGIREIDESVLMEIDTFSELVKIDPTYENFL